MVTYPYCPKLLDFPGLIVVPVFQKDPINDQPDQVYLNLVSTVMLGVMNIFYGLWTLYPRLFNDCFFSPEHGVKKKWSAVRKIVAFYQILTGLFFIELALQLNLVTLIFAALHNWVEWLMIGTLVMAFYSYSAKRYWNSVFTLWIFSLIMVVFLIPNILLAFTFEENFGIWVDFMLLYFAIYLYSYEPNRDFANRVWLYFVAGAIFHLAQIFILLAVGIAMVSPWPAGQLLINFTALFNYYFYTRLAHEWDAEPKPSDVLEKPLKEASGAMTDGTDKEKVVELSLVDSEKNLAPETPNPESPNGEWIAEAGSGAKREADGNEASHISPSICAMVLIMVFALVSATFAVMTPVYTSYGCPESKIQKPAKVYVQLSVMSIKDLDDSKVAQFREEIVTGMKAAYKADGNIMSKAFVSAESAAFLIYEKWETEKDFLAHAESMQTFYRSPRTSHTAWDSMELKGTPFPTKEEAQKLVPTKDVTDETKFCTDINKITGVSRITLKSHHGEAFEYVLARLMQLTRTRDPENEFYWMHRKRASAGVIEAGRLNDLQYMLIEQWASQDALEYHLASQSVRVFAAQAFFEFATPDGVNMYRGFRELIPCPVQL